MTNQEIFDKAVRGLRGQDFETCAKDGICVLFDPDTGMRCAWGHVDPENTKGHSNGTVEELVKARVGVAATLTTDQVEFGTALQIAHDRSDTPHEMVGRLRALATQFNLSASELEVK